MEGEKQVVSVSNEVDNLTFKVLSLSGGQSLSHFPVQLNEGNQVGEILDENVLGREHLRIWRRSGVWRGQRMWERMMAFWED